MTAITNDKIEFLKTEIKKLEDKIETLKRKDELSRIHKLAESVTKDEETLATLLHSIDCHWNHTDGCSWHYEINSGVVDWNGWAHARYLKMARHMIATSNKKGINVNYVIFTLAEFIVAKTL